MTESEALSALRLHTSILRDWNTGDDAPPPLPQSSELEQKRLLASALRTPNPNILLLGAGTGQTARMLAENLPDKSALTICELSPQRVRTPNVYTFGQTGRHALLLDSSPRAILLLLHACNRNPQQCTLLINPETYKNNTERAAIHALRRLITSVQRIAPPVSTETSLRAVSVATILHPEEPELPDFFGQFPADAHELIVFWDADAVPVHAPNAHCPTRHFARRINGDFAAQRNAALAEARGNWVFFLDGDERLSAEGWQHLPVIVRTAQEAGSGAVAWPRVTFWPDKDHGLIGFGLWPDLQVRLIRRTPLVRFERPVHEILNGYEGSLCIAAGEQILHYSRLFKDENTLKAKLAVFDAAGGRPIHRLNEEYPTVAATHLLDIATAFPPATLLRLGRI